MKFDKLSLCALMMGAAINWHSASAQQPSATSETYGSWIYRCSIPTQAVAATSEQNSAAEKSEATSEKTCETIQTLRDSNSNVIAQNAFGRMPGEPEKLVGVFQVPQGTLLSEPVRFGKEKPEDPLSAPYFTCMQSVCLARVDTDVKALNKLKGENNGSLSFADRSGRKINVLLSLNGFNAAIDRLISGQ